MTEYLKRIEAGDAGTVAFYNGIVGFWRRIAPYLIDHRTKEWWQAGYR
jgi:hypothetical protein